MKHTQILSVICSFLVMPMAAHAAGTYYTGGGYQSPQYRYNAGGTSPSAYAPTYSTSGMNSSTRYQPGQAGPAQVNRYPGYNMPAQNPYPQQNPGIQQQSPNARAQAAQTDGRGFYASAGLNHEFAQWEFSMKEAGSKLSYNNLGWNVLDIGLGYNFGKNNMGLKIDAGVRYGMQYGDSQMVDDDISNGGYYIDTYYVDTNSNGQYDPNVDQKIGDILGHALSVGNSSGGSMLGFNVGLAMVDSFKLGNVSVTPSIGYRYHNYKLSTKNNYGMSIDTGYCIAVPGTDEIQCDPLIIVVDGSNTHVLWDDKNTAGGLVDTGGTYYYAQPGKSHDYNVTWAGPYLSLDFDYTMNQNNAVSARVELGLPAYTADGNQPYRIDWQHPTSIKDSASIGDAYHLGLATMWTTALTNSVALQIGFTYDYYTMSGADATTYLSENYYLGLYWSVVNGDFGGDESAAQAAHDPTVMGILDLIDACPGWVCKSDNEVDSFYKSLGIRVGISATF